MLKSFFAICYLREILFYCVKNKSIYNMAMKNGTTILIIAIAVIGIALGVIGFWKSSKDKSMRAQFAGVSNVPVPSSHLLPYVDLGTAGDDIRYTINRASAQHTGDPDWLKVRHSKKGMHGIDGATSMDHSLNSVVRIAPPVPIEEDGRPLIVASGPHDHQNHETVAGTFLPATGRMVVGGTTIKYPYFSTRNSWGYEGTPHTPQGDYGLSVTEDLMPFGPGQAHRYGTSQTPSPQYMLEDVRPTVEESQIAAGLRPGQGYWLGWQS
jgi:hypothetical protein